MGLSKFAVAGTILAVAAVVLSACSAHHARHPVYREAGTTHHHRTTVVHPPARHRTVIVKPPARHRTVIVRPPARHRTVIVRPPKRELRHIRRDRKQEAAKRKHRADHRQRVRTRHANPPVQHRSTRVGSTRNPQQVLRSGPVKGHISRGRPGRPDVVMPKTRPHGKRPSEMKADRSKKRDRGDRPGKDSGQ